MISFASGTSGDDAQTAHVTVLPRMGKLLKSAAGGSATIGAQPVQWEPGAGIEHAGFRLLLPPDTTLRWPVLPHDPYKKDGAAEPSQGRIVLDSPARGARTLIVEVPR